MVLATALASLRFIRHSVDGSDDDEGGDANDVTLSPTLASASTSTSAPAVSRAGLWWRWLATNAGLVALCLCGSTLPVAVQRRAVDLLERGSDVLDVELGPFATQVLVRSTLFYSKRFCDLRFRRLSSVATTANGKTTRKLLGLLGFTGFLSG